MVIMGSVGSSGTLQDIRKFDDPTQANADGWFAAEAVLTPSA
jgi:hypothetical protein